MRKINRLSARDVATLTKLGIHSDGGNLYLRITASKSDRPESATLHKYWIFKYASRLTGKDRQLGIGPSPDISLAEARVKAQRFRKMLDDGDDPIDKKWRHHKVTSIEQFISSKSLGFLKRGVEPSCYLYRHYHPNGDLLYVGITLHPLHRTAQHKKEADWRDMICRILIEPFETREEALAAEELAIRSEFPKFNATHNVKRHPLQEIARLAKNAAESQSGGLLKLRREYKKESARLHVMAATDAAST